MDWSLFFKILKSNIKPAAKAAGVCALTMAGMAGIAALVVVSSYIFGRGIGFVVSVSFGITVAVLVVSIIEYIEEKRK